jgi:hypothetical protein
MLQAKDADGDGATRRGDEEIKGQRPNAEDAEDLAEDAVFLGAKRPIHFLCGPCEILCVLCVEAFSFGLPPATEFLYRLGNGAGGDDGGDD